MKTKFAIGCLVQWYEVDLIRDYVESLADAIKQYDGEIIVDCTVVMNQDLEKTSLPDEEFWSLEERIYSIFKEYLGINNYQIRSVQDIHTIADYRRKFNQTYCNMSDVLIWGESDMLVPKQAFVILNSLHQQISDQTPKYLATFGICKMWDNTWTPLEHTEFTDKPFIEGDSENWWSIPYTMTKDEMNTFNDSVSDLDVRVISPHKFNGCGLVISSEVIRAGVNIPSSVFFIHEDSSFMLMTNKLLGNIPQYHFKNILLVHNRKHPKKRMYIDGEQLYTNSDIDAKRKSHDWYSKANKMCSENCYNLFNPGYKSYTWQDVWK